MAKKSKIERIDKSIRTLMTSGVGPTEIAASVGAKFKVRIEVFPVRGVEFPHYAFHTYYRGKDGAEHKSKRIIRVENADSCFAVYVRDNGEFIVPAQVGRSVAEKMVLECCNSSRVRYVKRARRDLHAHGHVGGWEESCNASCCRRNVDCFVFVEK